MDSSLFNTIIFLFLCLFWHWWVHTCLSSALIWSSALPSSFWPPPWSCSMCSPDHFSLRYSTAGSCSCPPALQAHIIFPPSANPISTLTISPNLQIFYICAPASLTLGCLQQLFCTYICHNWSEPLLLFLPVMFLIFIYFPLVHLAEDQEGNTDSVSTPLHTFVRLLLASLLLSQGTAIVWLPPCISNYTDVYFASKHCNISMI